MIVDVWPGKVRVDFSKYLTWVNELFELDMVAKNGWVSESIEW